MRRGWVLDNYNLWLYVQEVESIQDGVGLPRDWRGYRRWRRHMPIAKLKAWLSRRESSRYYVEKFGYVRNGDVYEVDEKCIGVICLVVILASGGISLSRIARTAGISESRVKTVLRNYKYYVGWHNAYTMDGRRIWPAIREVELLHKDVVECQGIDR